MRASSETYHKVAKLCSSYSREEDKCGCCNSTSDTSASCTNCVHFEDAHCNLDLYDSIMKNHSI